MARSMILTLAIFAVGLAGIGLRPVFADEPFDVAKARQLLEQLGAPKYSAREAAGKALLRLGVPVLPVLSEGTNHPNREVRYRSAHLLEIVSQADFQRRVAAFESSVDDSQDFGLPLWSKFRDLVGPGRESRRIFAEMQRAETALMRSAAEGDDAAKALFTERITDIQGQLRITPQGLAPGTTAALLFVSGNERVTVPDQHGWVMYNFVMQPPFSEQLRDGPRRAIYRKLLGNWIRYNTNGSIAYQAIMIALQYDLPEALGPAEKMLDQAGLSPQVRQFAILSIAKFGDETWIKKLEPLLEDAAVCIEYRRENVPHKCQIRDLALVAIIHLSKQDPTGFGFPNAQKNPQYLYNSSTLGFKNDSDREEARKKWKEFQAGKKS